MVLANDTDRLEADAVLLNSVAESLGETLEVLDPSIEGLLAASSPAFKLPQLFRISGIGNTDETFLAIVPPVPNDPLVWRDLVFESRTEHCHVMRRRLLRALHPDKCVFVDRQRKFIRKTSLSEFVGEIFRILAEYGVPWLTDPTVHPVNGDEVHGGVDVVEPRVPLIPVLWPHNLNKQ